MNENKLKQIDDEKVIFKENGYVLTQQFDYFDDTESSIYRVYDEDWNYIGEFTGLSLTDSGIKNFRSTSLYETFLDIIDESYYTDNDYCNHTYTDYFKDYNYKKEKTPEEIAEEKKLVDSLCKSDTIVFHQSDPTTIMLNPIYEGKGWDVYQGSSWSGQLSKESIHELINRHDKIVCLGHGTPNGLLSGIIGKEEVPLLKDKKIFSMWCYAATFWKNNGFSGHGILTSDNFPSEVSECKWTCDANVSKEWIFENMMLAGEVAGKAIDISWNNPQEACDLFRKEYSEKSVITTEDEQKVVEFNTNSMQVV